MKNTHCSVEAKYLHRFLSSCNGNWHNCIYVGCNGCKMTHPCEEPGFLFLPDESGAPLLLPIRDANLIFSRIPEPTECLMTMTRIQFLAMYESYIRTLSLKEMQCPCLQILDLQQDKCLDW